MRFSNPFQKRNPTFFRFLLWQFGYFRDLKQLKMPAQFKFPNRKENIDPNKPCVTWVNHSTFWIQAHHKSLLTDPIWSQRCSPFSFFGPKRHHAPSPSIDSLQKLDVVLISHNHYDHLDLSTIRLILKKFPTVIFVVSKGLKKWFHKKLPWIQEEQVFELGWWEHIKIENMDITAVPSQHFSGRSLWKNRSLWCGYVVSFDEGKKFYFAGDTGYNSIQFKEIGQNLGPFDLSLIPIGSYDPRDFMEPVHVCPEESVKIHQEVRSFLSIAGHWKTFKLSDESLERPPFDLYCALKTQQVSPEEFRVLEPGQTVNWGND